MPDKTLRMTLADSRRDRPVMLAIAGDSAAGKTTLTQGLVDTLGADRITSICVDDYHRYDRAERTGKPFTALHPDANYVQVMEQHLQLLATGQPVLKPVYDHATGLLSTKLARACFDVTVYLDPPEEIRRGWKTRRDVELRGYTYEQVEEELARREPEAVAYIRPQRQVADIVVRFAPVAGRADPPGTPLSAELLLRPTIRHPDLSSVLAQVAGDTMHLKLIRDTDGRPVDALHVHGHAPVEESTLLKKAIWAAMGAADVAAELPGPMGVLDNGSVSDPLAVTQLLLLYHLLDNRA
jgi:phosphoribulokinase